MGHREEKSVGMRIWDILPGLFGAFNWREETCYSPALKQLLGTGKRRLCLVVIDGMGQQLLSARRGHIPFMRPYLSQFPVENLCTFNHRGGANQLAYRAFTSKNRYVGVSVLGRGRWARPESDYF